MEHFINYVDIQNFKSIANLKLEDCRRINLFIGYPNVGKSNVLEALSLFSVPFLELGENLNKLVRLENRNEISHNIESNPFVATNLATITISDRSPFSHTMISFFGNQIANNNSNYEFDKNLALVSGTIKAIYSTIKRYTFQTNNQWQSNGESQLLPPFGENIIDVLSYNPNVSEVKAWMKEEFKKFGLEYVLDKSTNSLKVQKRLGNDEVLILPYSSIADTLQRLIFYKTAIASNKNSVLLFEEPETHAFPPYIQTVMQDIIDAETNQFFIVTHSPLVVNAFLEYEKLRQETSIYLFDFKNDQTIVKRLTDEELDEVYNYDVDLFFNIESFLRDE
ncbi:MAG: AAA family ATPase [Prevotellaceae bacterium]|jgi:AAA15 family ATPase/GTPase|nr:AAA family ATPase [Prevotellaceae bacterium]